MSDLYDVVFYGTDHEGEQLKRTKQRVAKLLGIDQEKLESLFSRPGGVVLRTGVPQDVATKYQMALTQVGVRCNSKPSKTKVSKLELVPTEEAGFGQTQFVCPACGYQRTLETGGQLPAQCEQCGIVPEKYEKASDERMERERIRRSLLKRHKTSIEEEQRLKQEKAAQQRRQRIEEEIRKQLGLPRYLASRTKLYGSAAVVLVAGFGIGIISAIVYNGMTLPSVSSALSDSPLLSASATEFEQTLQSLDATGAGSIEIPGLKAVTQLAAFSKELEAGNHDAASGEKHSSTKMDVKASQNQAQSLTLEMLGEMRQDGEWAQFLTSIVRDLVHSRKYNDAYQISSRIQADVQRIDLSGEVAFAFAGSDTTAAIIANLKEEAHGLPNPTDQVIALGRLAAHQAKAGNEAEAQQTVQEALTITNTINASYSKAVALSRIAAMWAAMGSTRQSQEYFEQVNTLLASITDNADRISAFVGVAQAYARAGNKSGASRMLQETRKAAQNINNADQRFSLLASIAINQAQSGDIDAAVETARHITPALSRDAVLFKIAADQLYSGHIYRAMAIVEPIESATYKARTYALLARFQRDTALNTLAEENFDRAIESSNRITNDADKASILSEVARLQMRTGDNETARKLFNTALLLAKDTGKGPTHDIISALIAKNQARALQTAQAEKTLLTIADSSIANDLRDDISHVHQTVSLVKSVMPRRIAFSG